VSNSCPVIVPLASVAVFRLPPESRKYLCLLKGARFESYSAHHFHLCFLQGHTYRPASAVISEGCQKARNPLTVRRQVFFPVVRYDCRPSPDLACAFGKAA
jgi:hypothetical protein